MITTIILTIAIGFGVFLIKTDTLWNERGLPGYLICVFGAGFLLIHLLLISSKSYEYEGYVQTRQAFVSTLENARKNGSPHEITAIAKDIAKWNIDLAEYKFRNSRPIAGQYVDDRFETLEPIK